MQRIAILRGAECVGVIELDDAYQIGADGLHAVNPTAVARIVETYEDPDTGESVEHVHFTAYAAVYEPWMNDEAWHGCTMLVDDGAAMGAVRNPGGAWTPHVLPQTWEGVRNQRDALLAATDRYDLASAVSRYGQATVDAVLAYRQALRDLPQAFSDPNDVVWPRPA